ncbi:SDR family oxidoreductase [Plantactinospora sp. KLBMP9567]|uniref:SDR family oxidoreductase n=1 Tax=Plantactinospora sp. KLBMP9567 TaxID=3085900 RepID=UPI002981EF05|nr:SDR family oxidoreductase [Plantactinospora sp. KLBMP9567]MDW5324341.1 SDR family oxidoreductase [Plantactinospora sp. KLBMP9567]
MAAVGAGGGLGVLDLAVDNTRGLRAVRETASLSSVPFGIRVAAGCEAALSDVERAAAGRLRTVVVAPDSPWPVAEVAARHRVLVEVTDLDEARRAATAGAYGLIVRGSEAGGRVGELSSFVLMQRILADDTLDLPVWVCGGIGPRTAAACVIGGARGVVLDSQLALMPEADLPDDTIAAIRRMDGSETVLRGHTRGMPRPGTDDLLQVGQDGGLASEFVRRWPDAAAAVRGVRTAILDATADDAAPDLLASGAPLARALGVRLPVAQGPMTRVSDEAPFAAAVADGGGLPFVALALADAERSRRLLRETAAALGDRPWGVGILGFVPDELRAAQLEVIREIRPTCVIVAGGRPAQATVLEADGIATFLHVPSPGLLRQFLAAGARRFVFEGAECGGHVGPRASFPLWEAQLTVIEQYLDAGGDGAGLEVFFAGGVHDPRSAAMVATMAAPLARRGVRVGVLMGTAYLFTREAVECGAIRPGFQREALAATGTALLETAPGHATRCLPSPFVDDFHRLQAELSAAGADSRQVWQHLEMLNVGRLRLASKGVRRDGDDLVAVDEQTQAAEGLFMAGQVAVLRDEPTTIADLHAGVTGDAAAFHRERTRTLRAGLGSSEPAGRARQPAPLDIAIVGMACVFPGSPDLAGFWRTILDAEDAITEVPAQRWDVDTYYRPEVGPEQAGRYTVSKWGGFLRPVPFDAIRYGIPPAALGSIDPTQLLALEVAHRALLDAGYPPESSTVDRSRIGVVFGAEAGSDMGHAQTLRTMLPGYLGEVPAGLEGQLPTVTEDSFPGVLANVIAGRVANRLDLGGPNLTVDAACASSLAALDAACKELLTGDSDVMVCGAADLHNGINDFLMFTSAHALSPTGHCRTFDSSGDGIALGEGVACVVLRRLADAERDHDRIYAVIKGVGASSDGRALGLTAPRAEGQRRALDRAYRSAGVAPSRVGLVEAHGTGTVVGDRTELETLTRLFTDAGAAAGECALGSVKSQIGHTKCAAGLAGVIKVALSLHHGVRPPTINLSRPNPAWQPELSPFAFYTESRPWLAAPADRLAGVSAFGFGGTNYHAVLSGHAGTVPPRHTRHEWPAELFCFRGADRSAAHRSVSALAGELAAPRVPAVRLRDLAARLARESDCRRGPVQVAVVARDLDELATLLRRALAGEHDPRSGLVQPSRPPTGGTLAFLFPGQGSQRPGALADLFVSFPELRRYLHLGGELSRLLCPPSAFGEPARRELSDRVRDTRAAQPILGICGLAVDHLLRRLGVQPDAAAGHSYGELVALCVAGAFDEQTLLDLSRERADAILAAAGADPGTMAAVAGTARQVGDILADGAVDDVVVANHNAPDQVVISGPGPAIQAAVATLTDAGLSARGLQVGCAFHSPLVAGAGQRLAEVLARTPVARPAIPVWANRTAGRYPDDPDGIRRELSAQVGASVRFVDQIEAMYASGVRTFVETGPGQALTRLVGAVLGDRPHLAVACDGAPGAGLRAFLLALAELACAGVPVQTGWLFRGRDADGVPEHGSPARPIWTVDGQLVRDANGDCLPGGMRPPRRVEELQMTTAAGGRDDLVAEYLRTARELIASQRDVMLAYLSDGAPGNTGRLVWQPAQAELAASPAVAVPAPTEPAPEPLEAAPPVELDFQGAVLAVISERTGYPVDLVGLDLDLEADLSIDSIKRAEVAGEVATRLRLPVAGGDQAALEDLVKARTVRAMVEWLTEKVAATAPAGGPSLRAPEPPASPRSPQAAERTGPDHPIAAPTRMVARRLALTEPAGAADSDLSGATFLVTGAGPVPDRVVELLRERGATARTATLEEDRPLPADELAAAGKLDGLVVLDGLTTAGWQLLPAVFPLVKQALAAGPRWLLAAAAAGGTRADGLPGLFRTINREYPAVSARLVEMDGSAPAERLAAELVEEILLGGQVPVVCRDDGARYTVDLVGEPLPGPSGGGAGPAADGVAEARALGLGSDSVVVLIGGAQGITASFARLLASATRCHLQLVGRTSPPDHPEEPDTAGAADLAGVRAALSRRGLRSPAEIDRMAQGIITGREVEATVRELRDLGSEVRYHTLDVRDQEATHRLLKEIQSEYGRIDGVVFAAGIIEDKLLADKSPESFARVFGTKVDGVHGVLEALEDLPRAPRFVALYGSIAAAFGSRGQGDYAAANDAMATAGGRWAARTGIRCLTVHWGPWAPVAGHRGMVTAELSQEYARRGIALIDREEGVLSLLRELAWGDATVGSVVYTASGW